LRGSNVLAALALPMLAASTLLFGGCSGQTIVAVDPSCGDAGVATCPPDLVSDLVGFWRLKEAPGSTTARDWSPWGNNGMLEGVPPPMAWVGGGPEGGALSPQGMGYVNVPASASINSITTQVTVAAWIFLSGPVAMNSYATAISRQIGNGYLQHYHLSVNDQNQAILFITTTTAGQQVIGGPPTIPQQKWVHLAGTYDGSLMRLYVNGVEVAKLAVAGPFANETNPVVLSGNGNTDTHAVTEAIPGQLDQVLLYRRALSPDQIARLKNGALLIAGAVPPDAGP